MPKGISLELNVYDELVCNNGNDHIFYGDIIEKVNDISVKRVSQIRKIVQSCYLASRDVKISIKRASSNYRLSTHVFIFSYSQLNSTEGFPFEE